MSSAPLAHFVRPSVANPATPAPLISEVRVEPAPPGSNSNLIAYVDLLIAGSFAVHAARVIQPADPSRGMFVQMPCAPARLPCHRCDDPQPVSHHYCSRCGTAFDREDRTAIRCPSRRSWSIDFIHPVTHEARAELERAVMAELHGRPNQCA